MVLLEKRLFCLCLILSIERVIIDQLTLQITHYDYCEKLHIITEIIVYYHCSNLLYCNDILLAIIHFHLLQSIFDTVRY